MNFKDDYTTASRKVKLGAGENSKTEISEEAFLNAAVIGDLIETIERLRVRVGHG